MHRDSQIQQRTKSDTAMTSYGAYCFLLVITVYTVCCSGQVGTPTTPNICKDRNLLVFTAGKSFSNCRDLGTLRSYLQWDYVARTGQLDIGFTVLDTNVGDLWVSWGINPGLSGMIGAQALVSYPGPGGNRLVDTFNITGKFPQDFNNGTISISTSNLETKTSGTVTSIFATWKLNPNTRAINSTWQIGNMVGNGLDGINYHETTPENLNSYNLNMELMVSAPNPKKSSNATVIIAVVVAVVVVVIATSSLGIYVLIRKKKKKKKNRREKRETSIESPIARVKSFMLDSDEDHSMKWKDEIRLFDFSTLAFATNNFSQNNIIGRGRRGVVYKGIMEDGLVVAAKRLFNISRQGLEEIMNEVVLISRLQHRNLVQLLGACIEKEEIILIYEYMQNGSLDFIIFGEHRHLLDWQRRVEIILGIAKGLLYLHEDSRLKIIHRDLKPANVLLDEEMNAKISDFDTARLFETEQQQDNTTKVIGTIGYMPPEYANVGIFSIKSDVFSFGILLLEIISGKKNSLCAIKGQGDANLLQQAWELCKQENSLMLLDESLKESYSQRQVSCYIQIGLLCVQEEAMDRPTMSEVYHMLSHSDLLIKEAAKPEFCYDTTSESVLLHKVSVSNNITTMSDLDVR